MQWGILENGISRKRRSDSVRRENVAQIKGMHHGLDPLGIELRHFIHQIDNARELLSQCCNLGVVYVKSSKECDSLYIFFA